METGRILKSECRLPLHKQTEMQDIKTSTENFSKKRQSKNLQNEIYGLKELFLSFLSLHVYFIFE